MYGFLFETIYGFIWSNLVVPTPPSKGLWTSWKSNLMNGCVHLKGKGRSHGSPVEVTTPRLSDCFDLKL